MTDQNPKPARADDNASSGTGAILRREVAFPAANVRNVRMVLLACTVAGVFIGFGLGLLGLAALHAQQMCAAERSVYSQSSAKEVTFLGVEMAPGSRLAARAESGDNVRGALVLGVFRGSAAHAAGIRAGDIVAAVSDEPVGGAAGLRRAVRSRGAGETVAVRVWRGGEELTVHATLGSVDLETLEPRPRSRRCARARR